MIFTATNVRGRWTLVRTKRGPKEWLLIKKVDGHVREGDEAFLPPESVCTGRTVEEVGEEPSRGARLGEELDAASVPRGAVNASSLELMLAKTSDGPFSRKGWMFELKYDGYRMVAGVDDHQPYL